MCKKTLFYLTSKGKARGEKKKSRRKNKPGEKRVKTKKKKKRREKAKNIPEAAAGSQSFL